MLKSALACGLVGSVMACASSNPVMKGTPVVSLDEHTPATSTVATSPGNTEDASPTQAAAPDDATVPALAAAMPTACNDGRSCVPPKEFTEAACHGRYPSMAIAMFEKHTPWQRLYLRAESLDAVNAYGNRSLSAPLVFGEEVIVLRGVSQPKAGKLQISSSDIDILRWDGTCATVAREMFSTTRMASIAQATIPWRYLEETFQDTLLGSKYVAAAQSKYRSACKGSRSEAADPECQKAATKLSEVIGIAVRGGIALPIPAQLPAWAPREQVGNRGSVAMNATSVPAPQAEP